MEFTAALHLKAFDEIEAKQTKSPTRGLIGLVTVEDMPLFPWSAEQAREIGRAFLECAEHFEHARPLGVPDIKPDGMEATRAAQRAILDERDAK